MIKIGFLTFSMDIAEKVAEKFLKIKTHPPRVTISGPYVSNNEEENIVKTITIYEFSEDDEQEVNEYIKERYAKGFESIEGLKSRVEDWIDIEEAFKLLDGDFTINTLDAF
ncbi:MAG: hypothetical protein HQK76_12905 [Desulfobacterales bacterium]|nr:hypothetical protein [Desulfobacterales bacterium]